MIWFVTRSAGSIVAAFSYEQPGYAEETLDDAVSVELQAFLAPPIPTSITNAQLKRQLKADGKLATAKALIQQVDDLAEALWYGADDFLRTDPILLQLATALGYDTDAKLDAFFTAASKIT